MTYLDVFEFVATFLIIFTLVLLCIQILIVLVDSWLTSIKRHLRINRQRREYQDRINKKELT